MKALFPTPQAPLVKLNLDVLGVIDFNKGEAFLLATLFDSKFYQWDVTGDAAFFLRWKRKPTFILSIGGFHSAYKTPPEIPALNRLALSLSKSQKLQLRLTWYLALTSNTLQHGARLDLLIKASKFRIDGHLSYDALIQFDPFSFSVAFSAGVGLKWGSRTLASVLLEGSLAGPSPWHIKGKAKFKIWRFSKSVSFDRTIGDGRSAPPLPEVNPKPKLIEALRAEQNWQTALPEASEMLVTIKEGQELTVGMIRVHPLGTITVSQTVIPLKTKIEKFGNAKTSREETYSIIGIKIEEQQQETGDIKDVEGYFAAGQYKQLAQAEQLSRASFEEMEAGVKLASGELETYPEGWERSTAIGYETELITATGSLVELGEGAIEESEVETEAKQGASAKSREYQSGTNRFVSEGRDEAPVVEEVRYVITRREDLSVVPLSQLDSDSDSTIEEEGISYHQALEELRIYQQIHPKKVSEFQVVPVYELQ